MGAFDFLLLWVAAPPLGACAYLLLLTLLSARPPVAACPARERRFDLIVPAHNESAGIARTVASLRALQWPQDRFRVIVVADNCSDDTAACAAAAGAEVWERRDPIRRGKGHALDFAFRRSLEQARAAAVVVVDADSEVSPNLLDACAARLDSGAQAVQVHYGVLNAEASWRTRLMSIALSAVHILRSRARERLGLSCGIRGNGWCLSGEALQRVPYRAYSLAEDVEYGVALGLAGIRVHYAGEAEVLGEMVSAEGAARSQRRRWEAGRLQLMRQHVPVLLAAAVRRPSRVCLDLALDLLVLPLSHIVLQALLLCLLAAVAWLWFGAEPVWFILGLGCLAAIALYVLRGWQLSGSGLRGLFELLRAPWFLAWKLALMLRKRAPQEWVRTEREGS